MGDTVVPPRFTGDGSAHSTCSGALGAPFAAGSKEDGPGLNILREGQGNNPVFGLLSKVAYTASPALKNCQAPKKLLAPSGDLALTPNVLPVQLVRIGQLHLVSVPMEFTAVAGLRLRQTVADIVDAPLDHVIIADLSNGYGGYVMTPEEYEQGDYEAGHTLFGRWTLGAYQKHLTRLAEDMAPGAPHADHRHPAGHHGQAAEGPGGEVVRRHPARAALRRRTAPATGSGQPEGAR